MSTLVITVGTSLFTSASWRRDSPFGEIPGYRAWVTSLLEDPLARRAKSGRTADRIEERLRGRDADDLAHFEWQPSRPRRYSAELTTLLRCMENRSGRDLRDFLAGRYRNIEWVCPVAPEDPARIAADYLDGVFRRRLEVAATELRPVLMSTSSILDRVRHFRDYLEGLPAAEPVDLVVSGGYKVFAMFASVFAASPHRRERWKVLYVHEASYDELVVQGWDEHKGEIRVAVEGGAVPVWGHPTPMET